MPCCVVSFHNDKFLYNFMYYLFLLSNNAAVSADILNFSL